eukprot:2537014-Prymnesium_polylepis.1
MRVSDVGRAAALPRARGRLRRVRARPTILRGGLGGGLLGVQRFRKVAAWLPSIRTVRGHTRAIGG